MGEVIHLVQVEQEARVDSREIAAQLGLKHVSTVRLIDRYAEKFRRHGILRFEIEKIEGRGRPVRFALLSEDQCYFLLALSRNTGAVVDLKSELVRAFSEARKRGHLKELSVWQQLLALEIKDKASMVKARFGSRLMLERKDDLKHIRPQRAELERAFQPCLPLSA